MSDDPTGTKKFALCRHFSTYFSPKVNEEPRFSICPQFAAAYSDRETVKSSSLNKSCSNQEILENGFNSLFTFGLKYVKKCPARKNFSHN